MRLIKKDSPILKPQNQISEVVKEKAVCEVRDWFMSFGLPGYQACLLASDLVSKAISERIQKTASSAPDVYISDADKKESLVMAAKRMADALDEADKLDALLGELEEVDSRGEGNSL